MSASSWPNWDSWAVLRRSSTARLRRWPEGRHARELAREALYSGLHRTLLTCMDDIARG